MRPTFLNTFVATLLVAIFALGPAAPTARAAVAANDLILMQRNAGNTDNTPRYVPAVTNGLLTFTSSVPATITNSAGLRGAISDETGTGALVFADTPTLVTPVIGAATGTSLGLSGTFTSTGAFDVLNATAATTSPKFIRLDNTGASTYIGNESSASGGFFTGSTAYDAVFYTSTPQNFIIGGVSQLRLTSGLATFGGALTVSSTTASTSTTTGSGIFGGGIGVAGNVTSGGDFQNAGGKINYNLTVYGVGTAYALTNTAAAIDFGTTDPVKVLDKAGTYLILAQVNLAYNGATVVGETATIKVRRTNNTAADLSAVVVLDLPVATTLTHTYGVFQIPPFVYTTSATDDSITIFANVSAALGAGTIDATAIGTSLVAIRLY